jgi:hypothetical protein
MKSQQRYRLGKAARTSHRTSRHTDPDAQSITGAAGTKKPADLGFT